MQPIILIPARMASTRLPGKPLADIGGLPMIVHCLRRAQESGTGRVAVACDDERIKLAVEAAGGEAVLTRADHPSGSDRLAEALAVLDAAGKHDLVINLQGDMPGFRADLLPLLRAMMEGGRFDIGTLAGRILGGEELQNPAVVKIAMTEQASGIFRAHYFSRQPIPHGEGPHYHHIGVYAYRREALERFVALGPSPLESQEKLEQLRALEAGMTIGVALTDWQPLGVDTPEQLEQARRELG